MSHGIPKEGKARSPGTSAGVAPIPLVRVDLIVRPGIQASDAAGRHAKRH